jgi:hypothetical protein
MVSNRKGKSVMVAAKTVVATAATAAVQTAKPRAMNAAEFSALLADLDACFEAREWAKGKNLRVVWQTCDRADWLLWLVGRMEGIEGWPDRKAIVAVACDCAELALSFVARGEDRPRLAIETTRKWLRGEATIEQVRTEAAWATEPAQSTNSILSCDAAAWAEASKRSFT